MAGFSRGEEGRREAQELGASLHRQAGKLNKNFDKFGQILLRLEIVVKCIKMILSKDMFKKIIGKCISNILCK
jgi:hypothetical protein